MPARLEYHGALNSLGLVTGKQEPLSQVRASPRTFGVLGAGNFNSRHRPKTATSYTAHENPKVVSFAPNPRTLPAIGPADPADTLY